MKDLAIDSRDAWTEASARRALKVACRRVCLPTDEPELIRLGSNAVFRVDAERIARVAPSLDRLPNAAMQIAVARWLEAVGYPAVRVAVVDQPVAAAGRIVTFWKSIAPVTVYAPIGHVAALICRLHRLSPLASIALPKLRPFGATGDPIPRMGGIKQDDADYLSDRYAWARSTFDTMDFPLGFGVVHGDANVGNVLLDAQGKAVLIDLDSFSIGPREWDLIQTALFADRLGWHTAEEYRRFVEVYGYDITKWDGYETLADMREIAMTAWLSKKAATDEKAAAEAHKRITAMRTGGSRRDWGAY